MGQKSTKQIRILFDPYKNDADKRKATATKIFQSLDKDKSGFILIEELLPFVESVLGAWSEEIFYGPNDFDKKYGELNYFYQIISNTKFDGWATLKNPRQSA